MAQKSRKDLARANISTLNSLHIGTLAANALFILFNLLFRRRSLLLYVMFSIPSFAAQYVLEISGRPKYNGKDLKNAGQDLAAPGLTEYMFDVIWVTWFSLLAVMAFGNWAWALWGVVPVYGLYKGYGLLGMARGMMGGGQQAQVPEEQQMAAGNRRQRRAA